MALPFLPYSVAMVTPFDEHGDFHPASVAPLVQHLIAAGAPGLLISGSTGEQHCLSIEERCSLYQLCRDAAGPDIAIYAGVASFKTKYSVTLAQAAAKAGCNAIMLGFTPYQKISQNDAELCKDTSNPHHTMRLPGVLLRQFLHTADAITVAASVPETPIFLYVLY